MRATFILPLALLGIVLAAPTGARAGYSRPRPGDRNITACGCACVCGGSFLSGLACKGVPAMCARAAAAGAASCAAFEAAANKMLAPLGTGTSVRECRGTFQPGAAARAREGPERPARLFEPQWLDSATPAFVAAHPTCGFEDGCSAPGTCDCGCPKGCGGPGYCGVPCCPDSCHNEPTLEKKKKHHSDGGGICGVVESHLPGFCSCANGKIGAAITCAVKLFGQTIGVKLDLEPCGKPASMSLDIVEKNLGIDHKILGIKAGTKEEVGIPGLNVGIPVVGKAGVDAAIELDGNASKLKVKVGLDACAKLKFVGKKCGSDLTKVLPVWILDHTFQFSHVCDARGGLASPAFNATSAQAHANAVAALGEDFDGGGQPKSCIKELKKLCGKCHISKSCWLSCAKKNEKKLLKAGCKKPKAAAPLLGADPATWAPATATAKVEDVFGGGVKRSCAGVCKMPCCPVKERGFHCNKNACCPPETPVCCPGNICCYPGHSCLPGGSCTNDATGEIVAAVRGHEPAAEAPKKEETTY